MYEISQISLSGDVKLFFSVLLTRIFNICSSLASLSHCLYAYHGIKNPSSDQVYWTKTGYTLFKELSQVIQWKGKKKKKGVK